MSHEPKEWSEYLYAALGRDRYNCECQTGGADAMSIDTDALQAAADSFAKTVAAVQRVRDLHVPEQTVWGVEGARCEECGWPLPCRTLLELDGEQA